MEVLRVQKGQIIAKRKDIVKEWYLIQEGTAIQTFDFAEVVLEKNAIIGILENERFICDYIAGKDTVLAVFSCEGSEDLKKILAEQKNLRSIFLRAAIEQRHQMFCLYAELQVKTRQFHSFLETIYNDYKTICGSLNLEEQAFTRMDYFNPLEMQHKAENWEINNSVSLVKNFLQEYLQLMEKDDSLCVGAIMEASAQMRRVTQGIGEMVNYLLYNREILLAESGNDLFHLYFDLAMRAGMRQFDLTVIKKEMSLIADFIQKLKIYDVKLVNYRIGEYKNYDFENTALDDFATIGFDDDEPDVMVEEEAEAEDCLAHILNYAGIEEDEIEKIRDRITEYRNLPDILSTEGEAYQLRKKLTAVFYDVYYKVFMHAMEDEDNLTPIVQMFLNFGFMDVQMAGEENANALYDLTEHLDICQSEHIYTIFTWLQKIYLGEKEPSRNEFDMDYPAYLADLRKNGSITQNQVKELMGNREMKVKFEIQNVFTSGNKITYGKITTFCPILGEYDLINSIDKMLVTAEKIEDALNKVRRVDFSIFYRERVFFDPARDINREMIMTEVLPDVILMPNAGTKAMMWQETAGVKSDTPGRFLFPIFTAADIEEMMIETMGRFRWEICRKEQGVHWNDIRQKSLTSEYCDYIQFYRKNHELSADAKEKLKTALVRARNNYREVFVKDYQNWIKYESKGSFRLNKVSRDILVRYCPFTKEVRAELKANPMYQSSISRFEVETARKVQRIVGVYEKYKKAGGEITPELRENLLFYQM